MAVADHAMPNGAVRERAAREPSLWLVVVIFWAAFAFAVVATGFLSPQLFERHDPDSFLRLVQVRDLLAGQGWFDLLQRRMDPPDGALLHWSRLIDAPIAGLVLLGVFFGDGERFAMTVWPVLLFLPMMGSAAAIASILGGRAAAVWALVLSLVFINPAVIYLPNDIDHHNAQVALAMATAALALRIPAGMRFGVFAGLTSAVTLAIGLEMLPHVAIVGAFVALGWAITGRSGLSVAAFGTTVALAPALLFLLTASPAAATACDSISWAYVVPAAIAGLGLAGATVFGGGRVVRIGALVVVGSAALAVFVILTPQCLAGPYGLLSPELKEIWLSTVTEAQPFRMFAEREPVGALASLAPLAVALVVGVSHLLGGERRDAWLLPTLLLAMSTALSFYQIRTLPFASAIAIPILGAWIAGIRANAVAASGSPVRRALPVALGFLVAVQVTYLLIGIRLVDAAEYLSGGRLVPREQSKPPEELTKGLTAAEKNCFDPESGKLLFEVPKGLVLAPLFYGPTVLMLSPHDVVGGPYHRNGQAILDTINATYRPPAEAKAIVDARNIDYVVACPASVESAVAKSRAPDGLLANLLAGKTPSWLQPVAGTDDTSLKLWRVVR